MRPAPSRLLVLVLTAVIVLLVAPSASAHDALGGASPAAGSTVTAAPTEVRLTFAEPPGAEGLGVAVTGPDGASVTSGPPSAQANVVTQALVPLTRSGTYTVAYRVVSADGHPVSGTYTFVLALPSSASASPATPTPGATPAQTGSPAAEPTGDDVRGTDLTPWVIGLGLVAAAALGVLAARRRRT